MTGLPAKMGPKSPPRDPILTMLPLIKNTMRRLAPLRFHSVAMAVLGLGAAVASVAMTLLLVSVPVGLRAFIVSNSIDTEMRQLLLLIPAGLAMLVAIGSTIAILVTGGRSFALLDRLARICAPLLLLWAVPILACYEAWRDQPLAFLVLLAVFALGLEQSLRRCLEAVPLPVRDWITEAIRALDHGRARYIPLAVVLLGCIGYSGYFSYQTILEHHRMTTGTLDLGIGDNLMANALAGKFFRVPALHPDGSLILRGHAVFGMFLYLPFYAIKPCSETLLIIQAAMFGFAALPLYLFASTQVRRFYACVIAHCFLLTPIIHGPNFYDFHFFPTAMFFHFWLYYSLAKRLPWLTAITWFVLVAMREDVSMGLTVLGIVLALSGVRVKSGLAIAAGSAVMFVIIKFVIMPAAGTWFFADHYAGLYIPGEQSYGSVMKTIITNPTMLLTSLIKEHKLVFVLHVFAPLLFLSWRNPWLLLVTLAGFPSTLMVTNGPYILNIGFQYVTHLVPYVFGGAAIALRLMSKDLRNSPKMFAASLAMLAAVLLHSLTYGAVLQTNTFTAAAKPIPLKITDQERETYAGLVELRAMIPKGVEIGASPQAYPHVSHWPDAYDLENADRAVEYILLEPKSAYKTRRNLRKLLSKHRYGLLAERNGIYLFKRDHESVGTEAAWQALGHDYDGE